MKIMKFNMVEFKEELRRMGYDGNDMANGIAHVLVEEMNLSGSLRPFTEDIVNRTINMLGYGCPKLVELKSRDM